MTGEPIKFSGYCDEIFDRFWSRGCRKRRRNGFRTLFYPLGVNYRGEKVKKVKWEEEVGLKRNKVGEEVGNDIA